MSDPLIQDSISIGSALKSFLVIGSAVVLVLGGAYYFNEQRQQKVIAQYTQETQEWAGKNQAELEKFFSQTFSDCQNELEAARDVNKTAYRMDDVQCLAARNQLGSIQADDLKDSSAVAYLKVTDDNYSLIEASGKYTGLQSIQNSNYSQLGWGETRKDLTSYLLDGKEIPMWADYINYINGKEVIVPVSKEGTVIGYIFRGVIER